MTTLPQRTRAFIMAHPLATALFAGAIARIVAATIALGFFARDDYFHVLDPALRWVADPSFNWDATGLPGAGIRSHLVPRLVWMLVHGCHKLGVTEPDSVLRVIYLVVGTYSLWVIPGVYLAARRLLDERGVLLATWLAALHFAMPYAGTRLLIEAMAMPPLAIGIWLATYRSTARIFAAGLAVGFACWLRYQVGAAAIGLAIALAIMGYREAGSREAARRVAALAVGGVLAMLAQGLFDIWTTGDFLGPLVRNIAINLDPKPGLSRSTPFAYVGVWLLLTVPPATVVTLPAIVRAARKLPLITWPFVVFVVVHSFIPHKEDRFMLPAMPLFILLAAATPAALASGRGKPWETLRGWWPLTRGVLIGVHVLALVLACTAQTQANLRDAMIDLGRDQELRGLVSLGPELHTYFLGRDDIPTEQSSKVDAGFLARALQQIDAHGGNANRFIGFAPDRTKIEILLAANGLDCGEPRESQGWWVDRLVYRANPKRNRRRSPILIWKCETPAVARATGGPNTMAVIGAS